MPSRAAPWAPTRTMTPPTLSPVAASAAARRMSRRTTPTVARRSTRARPGIPAIASARSSASGSKNHSGGSRRSAVCARPGIVAAAWSSGSSCSPPRPTISFVFRRCWQQRDESVWSVKHETKPQRKLRVQRPLLPIDRLILAAHIRKIALQDPFFSSLLESLVSVQANFGLSPISLMLASQLPDGIEDALMVLQATRQLVQFLTEKEGPVKRPVVQLIRPTEAALPYPSSRLGNGWHAGWAETLQLSQPLARERDLCSERPTVRTPLEGVHTRRSVTGASPDVPACLSWSFPLQ